jgi:molybdopterin synthase catalytic subunit
MFAIVGDPVDVRAVEDSVRTDGCGAVVTFVGIVRAVAGDGRPVEGLAYEAYDAMVVAEFVTIANEACERHGAARLAIVHRVGTLKVGEVAVAVSASAPHRAQAFSACEYAIGELKTRAPIWKKERYSDGTPDRWQTNALEAPT